MKTTIWLKSQPKKIEYPDCWVKVYPSKNYIDIENSTKMEARYLMNEISRVEFRP